MIPQIKNVYEQDEQWYIASCPEISGANGQRKTIEKWRHQI